MIIQLTFHYFFICITSFRRFIHACAVVAALLPLEGVKELTITIHGGNRRPSPNKLQDLLQEHLPFCPPHLMTPFRAPLQEIHL